MKRITVLMASIAIALVPCSVAVAKAPAIKQDAKPAANQVPAPTVLDLGKLGKYRVTNTTVDGKAALRADKITTKAHAATPYLHLANADSLCIAWNDAQAVGNIRYVQAANSWPAYGIVNYLMLYDRYSNTSVQVWHEWHEWAPSYPLLAIHYACLVGGTDSAMVMQSLASTSVYWRYS